METVPPASVNHKAARVHRVLYFMNKFDIFPAMSSLSASNSSELRSFQAVTRMPAPLRHTTQPHRAVPPCAAVCSTSCKGPTARGIALESAGGRASHDHLAKLGDSSSLEQCTFVSAFASKSLGDFGRAGWAFQLIDTVARDERDLHFVLLGPSQHFLVQSQLCRYLPQPPVAVSDLVIYLAQLSVRVIRLHVKISIELTTHSALLRAYVWYPGVLRVLHNIVVSLENLPQPTPSFSFTAFTPFDHHQSMDTKFGGFLPRRGPGSLRGSLPKFLITIIIVCTVLVWMAGSVYRRDSLKTSTNFTKHPVPTDGIYHNDELDGFVDAPAPPPPEPTSPNPKVGLKHWWGVETPYHFRGEGPRNRTQIGREKASLVMLVRNRELKEALSAMKDIEDRFNRHYRYPWTFFNDEPFTDEFRLHTSRMASGEVQYGLIPKEHWSLPDHIDKKKFRQGMKEMHDKKIIYGGSESYRHMCRYNSGFFWQSELLKDFDWYWRVEPSTSFYCDQLYDPFTFMRENNKRYSFVMTMYEFRATIETLWSSTREFAQKYPQHIAQDNSLGFLVDDYKGPESLFEKDFNLCHFWSNFEIADLNLWRSQQYRDYFAFLDEKGGFFYERWGDAPVHSIAASLFLPKDQIHFFHDIGYRHPPYKRCPQDEESLNYGRCQCPFEKKESFDFDGYSCQKRWWKFHNQDDRGNPIPQYKIPDM